MEQQVNPDEQTVSVPRAGREAVADRRVENDGSPPRVRMIGTDLAIAGAVLALTVVVGLVAHECAHAAVLRLAGIDHSITYFPGRTDGLAGFLASCPWAVVRPHPTGRQSATVLRIAALSPLLLAAPVLALGITDHLPVGSPVVTAVTIGWLACSVPSPQDFSVAFYAHRALEDECARTSDAATPPSRAE